MRQMSCRLLSAAQQTMYQLLGGELSPYTAKVRSYLNYKEIQYERVATSMEMYPGFIRPKVGWSVIPVLVTPDKKVIQDSTDIINFLEQKHPLPSVVPTGPKQRIVAKLLELFSDEWLVQPIMHYRWSFPENEPFLKQEFGRMAMPRESHKNQVEMAEMAYGKFKGMLPVLGITEKTAPEIEQSFKELLAEMSAHFDKYPYFLGGRPCIGDFSFGGMMYAHLFRDPVPGYLMKTTAPVVATWCEMMNGSLPEANRNNLHVLENGWPVREKHDSAVTDYCANDEIPDTLLPILSRMLREFGPILMSTRDHLINYIENNVTMDKTKLPRLLGTHTYTIRGVEDTRSIIPFNIWMWQQVTNLFQSFSKREQDDVMQWVKQLPHGQEIVGADLSRCAVCRLDNFLHVAYGQGELSSKL